MTERDAVLHRFDLAARAALLAAGLFAQGTMWAVGHSRVYLVGAALLIAVSAESARRPLRTFVAGGKGARRRFSERQIMACRIVVGVLVVEVCLGVVGWLQIADLRSMATPLGVLLGTVQIAHAMAVESRRDLKLGCAVVVALLVHAGAFTGTAAVTWPMLLALLWLLTAAALLQRASVLAQVDAVALPGRAPLSRAWVGPVATAAVVGFIAFLAIPNSLDLGIKPQVRHGAGQPVAGSAASTGSAALTGSAASTGSAAAAQPAATGSAAAAPSSGTRAIADPGASKLDLRVRGDLPDVAMYAVPADAPVYWQGSIFDHFDGTSWTATGAGSAARWPVDGTGVQNAPAAADAASPGGDAGGAGSGGSGARRTDTVDVLSAVPLDVVLAPGQPTAYRGPGQVTAGAAGTARLAGGGPANGVSYQVTSTQTVGTAAQLRASAGAEVSDPQWRTLPADLPARVRTLAADVAGNAPSRYDAVEAVEGYLRTHETYDLTSPVPAKGHDAVDDFLFTTNRGFCEQFATAAVIMLRSLGIPARLVVGFAGGDTTSQPGTRILRGTDAHAWVQVWYDGVGWVNSDPTASAVLPAGEVAATQPAATQPAATQPVVTKPAVTQPAVTQPAVTQPAVAPPSAAVQPKPVPVAQPTAHLPGGRLVWFELIGAGVLLAAVSTRIGSRLLRRRSRRPTMLWRPTDGPVLQAYLRLDASLAEASNGRAPQESLREVGRRLGGAGALTDRQGQSVVSPTQVSTTLQVLERECYGIEVPSRAEVVAALEVLDRLRKAVGSSEIVFTDVTRPAASVK